MKDVRKVEDPATLGFGGRTPRRTRDVSDRWRRRSLGTRRHPPPWVPTTRSRSSSRRVWRRTARRRCPRGTNFRGFVSSSRRPNIFRRGFRSRRRRSRGSRQRATAEERMSRSSQSGLGDATRVEFDATPRRERATPRARRRQHRKKFYFQHLSGLFVVSRDSVPFVENTSARASSHRRLKTRSRARERVVASLLDDGGHGGRRDRRLAGQRFGRGGRGAGCGSRARLVLVDDRCCCGRRHRALGGDDVRARGPRADDRRAVLSRPRGASREADVPPARGVEAFHGCGRRRGDRRQPRRGATTTRRRRPRTRDPAPRTTRAVPGVHARRVRIRARGRDAHPLFIPGRLPGGARRRQRAFRRPGRPPRRDAIRSRLGARARGTRARGTRRPTVVIAIDSTVAAPRRVHRARPTPRRVCDDGRAHPPRADAIRSDAASDPHLDLADSSAPAGLGALGGWALGGFGAATRLARDSLRAVASSDLADKTARAANGVRRGIVNLSKHVAGDDLAVASSNPAGDEIATDVPEVDESRDSLWRTFGNLARESARALESALESAATRPEAAARASSRGSRDASKRVRFVSYAARATIQPRRTPRRWNARW